jgi:hypothetical protein
MRRYAEPRPVQVWLGRDGQPAWIRWLGRRERARVCNTWQIEGAWWDAGEARRQDGRTPGDEPRVYYSLLTISGALLTVYEIGGQWLLEQVAD